MSYLNVRTTYHIYYFAFKLYFFVIHFFVVYKIKRAQILIKYLLRFIKYGALIVPSPFSGTLTTACAEFSSWFQCTKTVFKINTIIYRNIGYLLMNFIPWNGSQNVQRLCIMISCMLFLREKCITPLKKGKIWSGRSLQAFFVKFGVCTVYEPVFP
jgi:hypothetical protein